MHTTFLPLHEVTIRIACLPRSFQPTKDLTVHRNFFAFVRTLPAICGAGIYSRLR